MSVDDDVEAMYRRLCFRQKAEGPGSDISLAELRLALGVTEAQIMEAVQVARLSDDRFIAFTTRARDRVTLGSSWQPRCEGSDP